MIEFRLSAAHPAFAREIEATLRALSERFPFAPLKSVSLYEPLSGDTSMAATYAGGRIELNAYWFAGDPDRLNDAAKRDLVVDADGIKVAWHGLAVREPAHVLTHEFWHVGFQAFSDEVIEPWQHKGWLAATRDPMRAPSGYALGHDPGEWAAETGALYSLGLATPVQSAAFEELLRQI